MTPSNSKLWEEMKAAYRRSCDLACAGEAAESARVLRDEVVPRFGEWARLTGCPPENRHVFIENLTRQERRRMQSAWVRHHVEARTRRTDLEQALKQERRELQRGWAVQADIGQQFAEIAVHLPAPVEAAAENSLAPRRDDRPDIDDVANIIDFVLKEQKHNAAEPAPRQAVA